MSQGDRPGTLVDYVTGQMERRHPGDLRTVFAQGGEFEILTRAARHKVPDLEDELRKFRSQAEQLHSRLQWVGGSTLKVHTGNDPAEANLAAGSSPADVDDILLSRGHLLQTRIEQLQNLEAELKLIEERPRFFHVCSRFIMLFLLTAVQRRARAGRPEGTKGSAEGRRCDRVRRTSRMPA